MPNPVVAIIIAKAAEKLGERIGDEIGDAIFGEDNEFEEIKRMLERMEKKIGEILQYSRATYSLVSELPAVFQGIINEQTLYLAHNSVESSFQTYLSLPNINSTINYDTFQKLLENWNIIIDMEQSTERLVELPKYGEFLLLISGGKLFNTVKSGLNKKQNLINSSIKAETMELDELLETAKRYFNSEYIKIGEILKNEPWISWIANNDRQMDETSCHSLCVPGDCFEVCNTYKVPNQPWNNKKNKANNELQVLKEKIIASVNELRSLVLVREVFDKYLKRLNIDIESKTYNKIKVLESKIMFPDE
jgi:hypothetical protein